MGAAGRSGIDGKKKGANTAPKDFKRKTAKVGKKVNRDNVTKIVVATKHIHIPLQNAMLDQAPGDERSNLEKLYKQLKHYSAPARLQAMQQLTQLVSNSKHTESYISILVPKALELLFDEDGDTRKALLTLMTEVVPKYSSDSFASIISIAVTYICSGLTSLNRLVRRDALSLLSKFTESHIALIKPFVEKLAINVAALVSEAASTIDQQVKMETPKKPDSRYHKKIPKKDKPKPKSGKTDSGKSNPDKKISYLVLIVQVLRGLVRCEARYDGIRKMDLPSFLSPTQSTFHAHKLNTVLTFTTRNNTNAVQVLTLGKIVCHEVMEKSLYEQLRVLWLDVSGRPKITLSLALVLSEVAELILGISASGADTTAHPNFHSLTQLCFRGFPLSPAFHITLSEAQAERQVKALLTVLDLTLCETAFILFSSEKSNSLEYSAEVMPKVVEFLLQTLDAQTSNILESDSKRASEHDMHDSAEAAVKPEPFSNILSQHHQQEIMRRLWRCIELVLPRFAAASTAQVEWDVEQQLLIESRESMWNIVCSLRKFIVAIQNSLQLSGWDALAMARPAILCVCHVVTNESMWSNQFEESNVFMCLVECLLVIPSLLVRSMAKNIGESMDSLQSSLAMQFLQATHIIVNRTSAEHTIIPKLRESVLSLFQKQSSIQDTRGTSKDVHAFFSLCNEKHRLLMLDIFYSTSFSALSEGAAIVCESLLSSPESIPAEQLLREQSHFLTLFCARRAEMPVDDVLDVLFRMLEGATSHINPKRINPATALELASSCACGNWLGREVASSFYKISSSHAPAKILRFITEELMQMFVRHNRSDSLSRQPSGSSSQMALWITEYITLCGILECFAAILAPLFRRLHTESGSEAEANLVLSADDWKEVCSSCRAMISVILQGSAHSPAELLKGCAEQQDAVRSERMLLTPFLICLVSPTPLCVGEALFSEDKHKYALMSLYLQEFCIQWEAKSMNDEKRFGMLRGIKRILEHDLAMGVCIALREIMAPLLQRCLIDVSILQASDAAAGPSADISKLLKSIPQ